MDKISIKGLKLFAYHGVNPEEKENGQKFVIDIDYYVDMTKACHLDDIDDTVSYAKVVKTVNRVFTNAKYDLIEHCAQVIADGILNDFDAVYKVDVTVKKPQAPIKADLDYVSVSISRSREEYAVCFIPRNKYRGQKKQFAFCRKVARINSGD